MTWTAARRSAWRTLYRWMELVASERQPRTAMKLTMKPTKVFDQIFT